MFKVIALLAKKPGLTREQFIDYYENNHAPLICKLLPMTLEYRRNFLDLEGAIIFPGATAPDFDVVTEIYYKDRDAYDAMLASHANDPSVGEAIARDEENFLDRAKTRLIIVEEHGGA